MSDPVQEPSLLLARDGTLPSDRPILNPSKFLRARRPEQYSDSGPLQITTLDRGVLEYRLETLTNRGEEMTSP